MVISTDVLPERFEPEIIEMGWLKRNSRLLICLNRSSLTILKNRGYILSLSTSDFVRKELTSSLAEFGFNGILLLTLSYKKTCVVFKMELYGYF